MSGTQQFKVDSLEEIALKKCYHDIISTLQMGNLKALMLESSLYSLFPQLTDQQIVEFVRQRLCKALTKTTLNDQVRKKLVKQLANHIETSTDSCSSCQIPNIFLFLDSVLDESFTKLEVKVPEKVAVKDENLDLIEIIAKRSPFLSFLAFNFGKPITEDMGKAFAKSFHGLKNLTGLTITDLTDDEYCIPFLENLGTSCPNLTHLTIKSKFLFESKDHILALVLGAKAKLLPKVSNLLSRGLRTEKFMKRAHFHSDLLTPFCNSLKHLLLQCVECKDDDHGRLRHGYRYFSCPEDERDLYNEYEEEEDYGEKTGTFSCGCASHHISRSFLAFFLRHMPNLEKVAKKCSDKNFEPSRAIEILHLIPSRFHQVTAFEEMDTSDSDEDDYEWMLFFGLEKNVWEYEDIIVVDEEKNQIFSGINLNI